MLLAVALAVLPGCTSPPNEAAGPQPAAVLPDDPDRLAAEAQAYHARRSLSDASLRYARLLELEPPRPPTDRERDRVLALAPRLYTVPGEPFALEDVAVVLHPDRPLIAYHLFWDDDLDYPEDNDPTDHEVLWVAYDSTTGAPEGVYTYFHGDIVVADLAVDTAEAGRPWIAVEWGKHGSLPRSATGPAGTPPHPTLEANWTRLHNEGTRLPGHPLARGWPVRFAGDFDAYRAFRDEVDPRTLIREKDLVLVSRRGNAVIDQHFLPYNFSAKPEWPDE